MTDIRPERTITRDTLFDGRVHCHQYKEGYRFSIDSVLVSHFVQVREGERVLDLGSGCGVIGLILLHRNVHKNIKVTGLEKQELFVEIARKNIFDNNFSSSFDIIKGDVSDIRRIVEPESYSMVISNPPFYSSGRGRPSRDPVRNEARHQPSTVLRDFVKAASFAVKNRGRCVFVYPATQIAEMIRECSRSRLEPKKVRFVYPYRYPERSANLTLLETSKNGGTGLEVHPPLYIYEALEGDHTKEVEDMYR